MWVRNYAYLFCINAKNICIPWNAEEPTPKCDREGVKYGGFPSGVVSDQQIEMRVEIEFTMVKSVEILNRQMVNPHAGSSLVVTRWSSASAAPTSLFETPTRRGIIKSHSLTLTHLYTNPLR